MPPFSQCSSYIPLPFNNKKEKISRKRHNSQVSNIVKTKKETCYKTRNTAYVHDWMLGMIYLLKYGWQVHKYKRYEFCQCRALILWHRLAVSVSSSTDYKWVWNKSWINYNNKAIWLKWPMNLLKTRFISWMFCLYNCYSGKNYNPERKWRLLSLKWITRTPTITIKKQTHKRKLFFLKILLKNISFEAFYLGKE